MVKTISQFSSRRKGWIPYVVFALFFVFLLFQFGLVGVQFDDYGYYTLNYAMPVTAVHRGTQFSFSEMFRFLGDHYCLANGRLLFVGLHLLIYKTGGLTAVHIAEAAAVTAIWILMYQIAMKHVPADSLYRIIGAVLLCFGYGLIPQALHQHGTYWHSAFFGYYPMIISAEAFICLYAGWYQNLNVKRYLLLLFLVFVSSWSGETWSIAVVCLTGLLLLRVCVRKRGLKLKHLGLFLTAAAGFALLYFSPGIRNRLGDRKLASFDLSVYLERMRSVFYVFLSDWNKHYVIFIAAACCIFGWLIFLQRKKCALLICSVISTVITLFMITEFSFVQDAITRKGRTLILCAFLAGLGYLGVVHCCLYIRRNTREWLLLFTAFMSVACLIGVPDLQYRVLIPFEVCSLVIIISTGYEAFRLVAEAGSRRRMIKIVGAAVLIIYSILLIGFAAHNLTTIYQGYRENSFIYRQNESRILDAKKRLDEGEDITQIALEKNADDLYASVMLYQQEWFQYFIDAFYEMPEGVEYVYDSHL